MAAAAKAEAEAAAEVEAAVAEVAAATAAATGAAAVAAEAAVVLAAAHSSPTGGLPRGSSPAEVVGSKLRGPSPVVAGVTLFENFTCHSDATRSPPNCRALIC